MLALTCGQQNLLKETTTMSNADFAEWRKSLGMTQVDTAKALGVSRRYVQAMESGTRPIPRYIMLACAALTSGGKPDALIQLKDGAWVRPSRILDITSSKYLELLRQETIHQVSIRTIDGGAHLIKFESASKAIAYRDYIARLANAFADGGEHGQATRP